MQSIDIDLPDQLFADALTPRLTAARGCHVQFSNGCSLTLEPKVGMFWGDDPYGNPWACNPKPGWEERVIRWLAYWSEPRDETGRLCMDSEPSR